MKRGSPTGILIFGVLIPCALVYATYWGLTSYLYDKVYKPYAIRSAFLQTVDDGKLDDHYPPVELIVLGDSTGKAGVWPNKMRGLFTLNLASNSGSALTSYYILRRYLEKNPAPKCVLFVSQYNWEFSYRDFFWRTSRFADLPLRDLAEIWREGRENQVFPADQISAAGYFLNVMKNAARLYEPPLKELRDALLHIEKESEIEKHIDQAKNVRGFQDNSDRKALPESKFINEEWHTIYASHLPISKTEDYYISKLADLARTSGSKIYYSAFPVADVDYAAKAHPAMQERMSHIHEVLSSTPWMQVLDWPETMSREYYFDFTHLNRKGAKVISQQLEERLLKTCLY